MDISVILNFINVEFGSRLVLWLFLRDWFAWWYIYYSRNLIIYLEHEFISSCHILSLLDLVTWRNFPLDFSWGSRYYRCEICDFMLGILVYSRLITFNEYSRNWFSFRAISLRDEICFKPRLFMIRFSGSIIWYFRREVWWFTLVVIGPPYCYP
jgi:hypothetical protein